MSFTTKTNCLTAAENTIYNVFRMIEFRDFYIPSKTMQFGLAYTKFSEGTNAVYAYLISVN